MKEKMATIRAAQRDRTITKRTNSISIQCVVIRGPLRQGAMHHWQMNTEIVEGVHTDQACIAIQIIAEFSDN